MGQGGAKINCQVKGIHRIVNCEEAHKPSEEKRKGKPLVL